jgi:acyl carrier protein phosphodiesterase
MNYLVHLYLAGKDEDMIIGNFIADHVKGNKWQDYKPQIQLGIKMHRAVDDFTDHHPLILEAKKYFVKDFGLTSGILVDVFFDHLFALEWIEKTSKQDLQTFTDYIHTVLIKHQSILPEKSQRFLGYMLEYNILYEYHRIAGIEQTLRGLSRRLRDRFQLWEAVPVFEKNKYELELFFNEFIKVLASNFYGGR